MKKVRLKTLNRYLFHISVRVVKCSRDIKVKTGKDSVLFEIVKKAQIKIWQIDQVLKKKCGTWIKSRKPPSIKYI